MGSCLLPRGTLVGRTNKPLTILVTDDTLYNHPTIQDLMAKGHTVIPLYLNYERDSDMVMGSKCHLMDLDHLPYLPIAMKEARKRKYGTKEATKEDIP